MAQEKTFENKVKKYIEDSGGWRSICGFEGVYEVSQNGDIRIVKSGKLKIPQKMKNRYMQVLLWKGKRAKGFLVHRIVAEAFLENPMGCTDVNHIDGNKQNNCVLNLEWCTRSENLKHAYKTHLRTASNQKLSIEDVKYIRENPDNLTRKEIAKKLNVNYWTVCSVCQNKCFKDVV